MRQLLYVSHAVDRFSLAALIELLHRARDVNTSLGVTGVLFYGSGSFLQLLEGEPADIDKVFVRVCNDERHEAVWVLADEHAVGDRLFPNWRMGFYHLSSIEAAAGDGLIANDNLELDEALRIGQQRNLAGTILRSFLQRNLGAFVDWPADRP